MSLEDVDNEIGAVVKLCRGKNENVITAFGWGQLPRSPYFFIDMELCDFNLEAYILKDWKPEVACKVPHFRDFDILTLDQKLGQILTIMRDIANGLAFIHGHNIVHRDLKPRNSTNRLNISFDH